MSQLNRALGSNIGAPAPAFRFVVNFPTLLSADEESAANIRKQVDGSWGSALDKTAAAAGDFYNGLFNPQDIIAESVSFSPTQPSAQPRFFGGGERYFPGFTTTEAAAIQIYEDVSYKATKYLSKWRDLIVDKDHNYNEPDKYKRPITVSVFDWIQTTKPVLKVTMQDAWLSNTGTFEYSYAEDGRLRVQGQFSMDGILIEPQADAGKAGDDLINIALSQFGIR